MGTTKPRRGPCSLSILLLASFVGVNAVWAQGEVSFLARRDFRVGESPNSVAIGDFNGDGRQGLATANSGPSEKFAPTVSILLGRGDGTFQTALDVRVGGIPLSITVGDFNSDGHQDVATANIANSVSILLGRGDGTFSATQAFGWDSLLRQSR
jgi:hypothetical protein